MQNVQMGGMNTMGVGLGGPVGGGGIPNLVNDQRAQLNTYIYEYFLRNSMYDCAKALLESGQPLNTLKDSPGRRRDENGNTLNGDDGVDGDSKEDFDPKRPADLPDPNLPKECPESCFLYEWWCLFWDMFNAQRGKADGRNVLQYYTHTQAQSRSKQEQQQMMLRGLRQDMIPPNYQGDFAGMRNQANGMNAQQNNLRQKAIQNTRNAPQQLSMMAQQKQQQQQAMQRDPSSGDNQQRAQSPASAENAASPSKRPRLDGPGFNSQQQQMPNGRGQGGMPQQVGNSGPSSAIQAAHMQLANGIESNLTPQQFQNMPGNPNSATAQRLAGYQASLGQQQQSQMPNVKTMPNAGGPPSQGSPMMTQGPQDGGAIANYYNPGEIGPNGMRPGQGQPGTSGNHALQDYQMQLMLLEQQNKKRLMMARQEQDSMTLPRTEGGQGAPAVGPNGQQPFQGTSPQGPRSVNSPNPGDQMKRTPHMNPGGIPSPLPEGQSRGSPSAGMNFIPGGQMDPSMNPQYMVGAGMPNGMRPPSSHPPGFSQMNMTPQQMAMAQQRQQAQQQQAQGWQGGPNGQMMTQPTSGAPQQIGTPQQRNMPPPSVPAAGAAANANGRAQPASPQQNTPAPPTPNQTNKANPKKKNEAKDTKAKRAAKKGSNALNAGATPSADPETAGQTPTPQTPITPVHPSSFKGQNGAVQPVTNGQQAAPANAGIPQPDPLQGGMGFTDPSFVDFPGSGLDFAPNNGSMDVLQDFDFDSFLHQDGEASNFDFDASAFLNGENEIGAD